jgi:hypothetical protein
MKILLTLSCATAALQAQAQEVFVDTLSDKHLNEVVIAAQQQRAASNATTYYPDKDVKRTAQSALDLLFRMGIPQVDIDPIGGTVQTAAGEEVVIYIDHALATTEEKKGLRAEDVKKVEFLVYPNDVRFNHNKYVINITLRHQDFGGYVKLTASEYFLVNDTYGQAYSKFSRKRMTYDVVVGDYYDSFHHTGSDVSQIFCLPQSDGSTTEITRSNLVDKSRYQGNNFFAAFRARYNAEKVSISNNLFINNQNSPHKDYSGQLLFSDNSYVDSEYSNALKTTTMAPKWTGEYYFNFGKGFELNVTPYVTYQHTTSNRLYTSDNTSILTNADEKAWNGMLDLEGSKTLSEHHALDIQVVGRYYDDKVKYAGNTEATPVFTEWDYAALLGYSYHTEKFYGKFLGGIIGDKGKISGIRTHNFYPSFSLGMQYAFNEKHSISLNVDQFVNTIDAADKTPDVIQENELLYKTGNPLLKNISVLSFNLQYTWLPCNMFSASATAGSTRYFDRLAPIYALNESGTAIVRNLENNGNYQDYYVGASFTAKLLNRKLVLQASPRMWFERATGIYKESNNYLAFNASAAYYLGKFYASAYYRKGVKELLSCDRYNTTEQNPDQYRFLVGWSNGKWNCNVEAENIFRGDWRRLESSVESKYFRQYTTTYDASRHRHIGVTISYTFNFGKKIRRDDEVEASKSGTSAIMQ